MPRPSPMPRPSQTPRQGILRRPFLLLPVAAAAAAGIGFFELLQEARRGHYNPHQVPNFLVGHPVPAFSTDPIPPNPDFSAASLKSLEKPVVVNFLASWCLPCHAEAPFLMQLKTAGVPVWGIDYSDQGSAFRAFLAADGNPFSRLGADPTGAAAIAWGISGVPESFLVDRTGTIRWHLGGPLSPSVMTATLLPLWQKYA